MADNTRDLFNKDAMDNINSVNNIFDRSSGTNYYNRFSRFGIIDPYTTLTGAREYLFFTKPDLNLFSTVNKKDDIFADYSKTTTQGTQDGLDGTSVFSDRTFSPSRSFQLNPDLESYPFFQEIKNRYTNVGKQLQASINDSSATPFMCMLSNAVRDTLDLPDISTRQVETAATVYGTSLTYEADDLSTDEAHTFSLEFEDTKYLEIYMLFKCWHEYLRRKSFGEVEPIYAKYRSEKIIHDQIAIFKFIVGEDGETLIHYSKLYGCRPQGVPRQTFSDLSSNLPIKYSVNWKAEFVEDMDPLILYDFNILNNGKRTILPLFDPKTGEHDPRWAKGAYITKSVRDSGKNPNSFTYKLKWYV